MEEKARGAEDSRRRQMQGNGTALMGGKVLWADQGERAGSRQWRLLGN